MGKALERVWGVWGPRLRLLKNARKTVRGASHFRLRLAVLLHIGLVGNISTVTVAGEQTAGGFCVVDMHIPPGGGPHTALARL